MSSWRRRRPTSRRRSDSRVDSADLTAGVEPRLRAQRRRYGEDVVEAPLGTCALISIVTTVGIVVALFVPAFEFFQEISIAYFFTGTKWTPGSSLRSSACSRWFGDLSSPCLPASSRCRRARRRDLPERVRLSPHAGDPQAGARDPGRHPDNGFRLLRGDHGDAVPALHPGSRSTTSTSSPAALIIGVMLMPTWPRSARTPWARYRAISARRPTHPARSRRRFDPVIVPAASRASWPRSCWPFRGPSARR